MFLAVSWKMAKESAARVKLGRSFYQEATVKVNVRESDFMPLWDGITMPCSSVEHKLLKGHIRAYNLGKRVQSEWLFCRQASVPFNASSYQ